MYYAWREFKRGKITKIDVLQFESNLEDSLFKLHDELVNKTYKHSNYSSFYIQDPKLRHIHKAGVYDRVLQQAVFRILYPIFDKTFIFDSYSSRLNKGTHLAVKRLEESCKFLSQNNSQNVFILKCDIKKFFDSVDQKILLKLIRDKIKDSNTLWLVQEVIKSFQKEKDKGLPLGNVTSQLFANIYLNQLDHFIKDELRIKYYLRYADDFVIIHRNQDYLLNLKNQIKLFVKNELKLFLHPGKVVIRKYHQGIDFLGYVVLPCHTVLRTKTKRRMFNKIKANKERLKVKAIKKSTFGQSIQSYRGMLNHCDGYKLKLEINKYFKVN